MQKDRARAITKMGYPLWPAKPPGPKGVRPRTPRRFKKASYTRRRTFSTLVCTAMRVRC
jgi:hypothetical protein